MDMDYCYMFCDEDNAMYGEYIFVECESREEADEIVVKEFGEDVLEYVFVCTPEEAEVYGYDTY